MSFSVTVLGSSAMYATPERAASGYLVEVGERRLWMDAGGGSWANLVSQIDHSTLAAISVSHRHPDHVIDVFQAFHARQYGGAEPLEPIQLWAPQEAIERILGFSPELRDAFHIEPVASGDSVDFYGARMSFVKMAHPAETLGVRLEYDEAVLAYSADTGPAADFETLCAGADLFICEATFQDSDPEWEGHMSASQAGAVAARTGVKHLLLSHLPAGRDLALSVAEAHRHSDDASVELAADGRRWEV